MILGQIFRFLIIWLIVQTAGARVATSDTLDLNCDIGLWGYTQGIGSAGEYIGPASFNITVFEEQNSFITDLVLFTTHKSCNAVRVNPSNVAQISEERITLKCNADELAIYINRFTGSVGAHLGDTLGVFFYGEGICKKLERKF